MTLNLKGRQKDRHTLSTIKAGIISREKFRVVRHLVSCLSFFMPLLLSLSSSLHDSLSMILFHDQRLCFRPATRFNDHEKGSGRWAFAYSSLSCVISYSFPLLLWCLSQLPLRINLMTWNFYSLRFLFVVMLIIISDAQFQVLSWPTFLFFFFSSLLLLLLCILLRSQFFTFVFLPALLLL